MTEKELKDLEKRLLLALASSSAQATAMKVFGLNFQNIIYADSNAIGAADGSSTKPFASLQDAIDKAATMPVGNRIAILVAPDSRFDEDIVIPGGRIISILGLGPWTIGDGMGSNFSSTTPRNVAWNVTEANPTTFRESLTIGSLFSDEMSSTHTAYVSGLQISGNFTVSAVIGTQSLELHLRSVKVVGSFDTTATPARGIQCFFRKCYFNSAFNSPTGLLNIVESTQFDNKIICLQYGRMWQCEIRDGMTASAGIASSALPPAGIFQSTFTGVFTGPASSLRLDTVTNYFFNRNYASLDGGATKILLYDGNI